MLTIERLRAMPPADKDGYLRSLHNQIGIDERDAMRNQSMAEEHERKAIECREYVGHVSARAREHRAYLATLEAAGLWPVAAPATTALRGELLMSGQTEAIDALDRLAKDGER